MRDDRLRLTDVVDACSHIVAFLQGRAEEDLKKDALLLSGVAHQLEIIGEASSHISEQLKNKYPEVPWKRVVGMRHHIAHGYFSLAVEVVWKTCTLDLPTFLRQIKDILAREWPE
jgi:uncharacterized protein with HEPN domain